MSGKPGKSGGPRKGAGQPRKNSGKVRVQFNLTPEAIAKLANIRPGKRSRFVNHLITASTAP